MTRGETMKTINEMWESFEEQAIGKDAHPVHKHEMKKGFFGGCSSMLVVMRAIGRPEIREEVAFKILEDMESECTQYAKELLTRGTKAKDGFVVIPPKGGGIN